MGRHGSSGVVVRYGSRLCLGQKLSSESSTVGFLLLVFNESNLTAAISSISRIVPIMFKQMLTGERSIRVAYFLKRVRVQASIKCGKVRNELLRKYGVREFNRIRDLYHKIANEIIRLALEFGATIIVLEDLRRIRDRIRFGRRLNGRLHRWGFRLLQSIIEYKALLAGIRVVYVDPRGTSSLCPICGGRLRRSPNGRRLLKCPNCGLEADRDVIGAWNLALRFREMWGVPAPPESPAMNPWRQGGAGKSRMNKNTSIVRAGQSGIL